MYYREKLREKWIWRVSYFRAGNYEPSMSSHSSLSRAAPGRVWAFFKLTRKEFNSFLPILRRKKLLFAGPKELIAHHFPSVTLRTLCPLEPEQSRKELTIVVLWFHSVEAKRGPAPIMKSISSRRLDDLRLVFRWSQRAGACVCSSGNVNFFLHLYQP